MLSFQPFWTKFVQTFYTIAGFGNEVSYPLGSMHCSMHCTSGADNLFVQKSRLNMNLQSFPAFGTRLWNCIHPDWRKVTKRAFKRKIHKLLLTVLEIEDYYVDAHSVILNLNTSNYYTL